MSETTGGLVDKVLQNFFNDFFFLLVVFIFMYKKGEKSENYVSTCWVNLLGGNPSCFSHYISFYEFSMFPNRLFIKILKTNQLDLFKPFFFCWLAILDDSRQEMGVELQLIWLRFDLSRERIIFLLNLTFDYFKFAQFPFLSFLFFFCKLILLQIINPFNLNYFFSISLSQLSSF